MNRIILMTALLTGCYAPPDAFELSPDTDSDDSCAWHYTDGDALCKCGNATVQADWCSETCEFVTSLPGGLACFCGGTEMGLAACVEEECDGGPVFDGATCGCDTLIGTYQSLPDGMCD